LELTAGIASNVRLALGGVAPGPVRANGAEQMLERKSVSDERVKAAAEKAPVGLAPMADLGGSAEYRLEMSRVLAQRALFQARSRAQAVEDAIKATRDSK
jgi:CO/xanthine dehydrogenase FAD-binding subunit